MSATAKVLWQSPSSGTREIAARIAIAGDFLPAGKSKFEQNNRRDWREAAAGLFEHFANVDACFVNLECVLDREGLPSRALNGIGEIVYAPSASLDYLRAIHARAVGLANNHALDFAAPGLYRTRALISQQGMVPLGAGLNLPTPPETCVWHGPGDVCVGFWAAAKATHDPATRTSAGVEPATLKRASAALASLRQQGARFFIALIHAGCLRTNRPDPEDVELLDSIARAGFHIVGASHSHRISGARQIITAPSGPAFCFYGLGSFVSGFISSQSEREGLIVVAGLNTRGELAGIEIRPVWIQESGFGAVPSPKQSHELIHEFELLSAEIEDSSYARRFYDDVSRDLLGIHMRDVRAAFRQNGFPGLARKASRVRMRHVRRLVHKVLG